jgi:hypothetical protein
LRIFEENKNYVDRQRCACPQDFDFDRTSYIVLKNF